LDFGASVGFIHKDKDDFYVSIYPEMFQVVSLIQIFNKIPVYISVFSLACHMLRVIHFDLITQ